MFSGVARYVCRPHVEIVLRLETQTPFRPSTALTTPTTRQIPTTMASICGNDSKLERLITRHLNTTICALTGFKGVDLDTVLRRDHNMPLNDFLTLSTVNRKILLLDSLKRYNADVEALAETEDTAAGSLTASVRHDLILQRGRDLLLELQRNAKKQ
eukprot:GILI01001857.1.p1 GENE.GILI01001857.1~~GILI01001857.1.p1  ORF type:complete len:157 (-),score=19.42 GILI01001857.1:218-688(-)